MPERLEPRLTEEQTRSVTASASGRGRRALLDERGESADEVDADLRRGAVERARYFHVVVRLAAGRRYRDRRHGNSLIDYRDAELERDFVADAHEVLRPFRYPVVYFLAEFLFVGVGAVE